MRTKRRRTRRRQQVLMSDCCQDTVRAVLRKVESAWVKILLVNYRSHSSASAVFFRLSNQVCLRIMHHS